MTAAPDPAQPFDVLPVPAAVLSPDAVFVTVNRAYQRMSGRSRDELVGRSLFTIFLGGSSGHGAGELRASLDRVLAEGRTDVMATRCFALEAPGRPGVLQERYWSTLNAPMLSPDGEVTGIVHCVAEITPRSGAPAAADGRAAGTEPRAPAREPHELNSDLCHAYTEERRTVRALRQAMERQRQAVSDTSHDLRAPITGLLTRLEAALADPAADPHEALRAALRDVERLGDIVADLLELARLDGDVQLPAEPVDLARLVETDLAHRTPVIVLNVRLQPGVVVNGSSVRLARLLGNLMANAERHAGSRVEVTVAADGDHAVLQVSDDGPGIPAPEREEVFRRFYRRHDARHRDPAGTGLGLPIAREIARAHGGSLNIADTASGTRMVLRLPLHASSTAQAAAEVPPHDAKTNAAPPREHDGDA
ncbi:PAS domain-containing sensor histidine kinase [Actinomadura miaoliensis]|uniref:histidine kinase n=1 Tax=Actinomadura miaoliensis TaxID=430685 RepID=A0ABP7V4Y8_9ACTN